MATSSRAVWLPGLAYYGTFKLTDDRFANPPANALLRGKNSIWGLGPEFTLALAAHNTIYGFATVRYSGSWRAGPRPRAPPGTCRSSSRSSRFAFRRRRPISLRRRNDCSGHAMDVKQLVPLGVTVSLMLTVFSFGLAATLDDALYLVRRPGLFVRSLLSMFVVVPLAVLAMTRLFPFPFTVEACLVALSVSPVPPVLPKRLHKSGAQSGYPIGLLATMSVLSIVIVPLAVDLTGRFSTSRSPCPRG